MVSNKSLIVLTLTAVGLLAWAITLSTANKAAVPTSSAPTSLIQGLDPSAIASIIIETTEGGVTLTQNQDGFAVKDKDNYPASTTEINNLISSCLDIKRDTACKLRVTKRR